LAAALLSAHATRAQTPIAGHYPPGQSGIRGASSPAPGWMYTNFSRFFSNLEVKDAAGGTSNDVGEVRYANISMFTWTTSWKVLGMRYGALAGIPFSTGNLTPSSADVGSSSFGLGDVLITPISLYRDGFTYDYQFQFTLWTSSGHFSPGGTRNRGSGYGALVYSVGAVAYPGGRRNDWSVSAVARIEQNFEQHDTGIHPGDDVVVDWGVGKALQLGTHAAEFGVSGFGTWQLTGQDGGGDPGPYRYFGLGPEASLGVSDAVTLRLRLHWEFATRNAVQGNNAWLIANFRL
jgi:hypothetical protein